jgi:hypothetical protein
LIELKPGTTLTLHDADRAQDFDYRFKGRRRHCGRPLFASQTMNVSLAVAAFGLGLAASPHCALMCGSTCAAITGARRLESIAFHAPSRPPASRPSAPGRGRPRRFFRCGHSRSWPFSRWGYGG